MFAASLAGMLEWVKVSFVPIFVLEKRNVTIDCIPFSQSDARHSCTIFFPGASSRFVPELYPPYAENFPPTLGLMDADSPVNVACSLAFINTLYTRCGVVLLKVTDCLIVMACGMVRIEKKVQTTPSW